jgi:hypothetical protein
MFLFGVFRNVINITYNVFLTIIRNVKNIDLRRYINIEDLRSYTVGVKRVQRMHLKNNTLEKRMKEIIKKDNGKTCHPYKPYIVSLKSRTLLNLINKVKNETSKYKSVIEDKIDLIQMINTILINVSKKLYLKFDPTIIYTFHNEINLVFFYKENGECIYDGNMNKILTSIVSCASIVFSKEFEKNRVNDVEDLDFIFDGHLIEFDKDYETLNFLIWRQFVCKRNTISLLYKCLYNNKDTNNMSISDMKYSLPIISPEIFIGNIIKKRNFTSLIENPFKKEEEENENDNDNVIKKNRKYIGIEYFYFHIDFKTNFEQYIKKKIL